MCRKAFCDHHLPIAIGNFSRKYPELDNMEINRVLYAQEHCNETFVVECERSAGNDVFIFEYECGGLVGMRSEHGTFDKYFMLIPTSHYTEYVNLNG